MSCPAAGDGARCWRVHWYRSRTSCCSMSRPITSISMRSSGWSSSCWSFAARCCSSVTIAPSSIVWPRASSNSIAARSAPPIGNYDDYGASRRSSWRRRRSSGAVRQEAGAGRGLDPPGSRGTPHPQRRSRARAVPAARANDARGASAPASIAAASSTAPSESGALVFEAEHLGVEFDGRVRHPRFLRAHHARRSHRTGRAQRRRQEHADQGTAGRDRDPARAGAARQPARGRLLRPGARPAQSG